MTDDTPPAFRNLQDSEDAEKMEMTNAEMGLAVYHTLLLQQPVMLPESKEEVNND